VKIDMAQATTEWLTNWVAEKAKNPKMSYVSRNTVINEAEAQRQYLQDKLELYVQNARLAPNSVVLYVSDLDRDTTRQLMNLEIQLADGVAVLDFIDIDTYHEAYCEEPSTRLEITFIIPKE
jgi:hypothetical protein